jgi:hypothetical protein
MLIVRYLLFAAPVVAAIVLAAFSGMWLLVALPAAALWIVTGALFRRVLLGTSAAEGLGPGEMRRRRSAYR